MVSLVTTLGSPSTSTRASKCVGTAKLVGTKGRVAAFRAMASGSVRKVTVKYGMTNMWSA